MRADEAPIDDQNDDLDEEQGKPVNAMTWKGVPVAPRRGDRGESGRGARGALRVAYVYRCGWISSSHTLRGPDTLELGLATA